MANTIYENFILENKIEDMLITGIDMNAYITPDYSLTENAGMKKVIHTYTATGNVEDLAMGEGNTGDIEVSFESKEYTVGTTQGRFNYFDEEYMTDPMVVESGLKGLADKMTNDLTSKAITAMGEATLTLAIDWTFDSIVDAIGVMNTESEDGLFLLINPAQKATLRKNLGQDLKYSEGFARTGYIGSICGVPVIVSNAVPAGTGFLATKEAVKCFVKKGVEIEQDRNIDTRKNTVVARKVMVIALYDATKCVKLTTQASGDETESDTPEVEPEVPVEPDTPDTPEVPEGEE